MNQKCVKTKLFYPLTLSHCPLLIRPGDGRFVMSINKHYYL